MDTVGSSFEHENHAELTSRFAYARSRGLHLSEVVALTDEVREQYPECFSEHDGMVMMTQEAQSLTDEFLPPPDEWLGIDTVAEMLACEPRRVARIARRLSSEGSEREGELLNRRPADTEVPQLFMSPAMVRDVGESIRNRQERERQREQDREITERFAEFADEMTRGDTLSAQEFKALVETFGPDSIADVLAQFRPDFSGAPVDVVRSFLTDYIGPFLLTKGRLNLDNLALAVEFLNNQTLKNTLVEVVKRHCLSYYQKARQATQEDDLTIISDHLQELRQQFTDLDNINMMEVLEAVEDYYTWLFVEVERPQSFVHSITGDRPFPDLNQRINVGELVYEDLEHDIYPKRRFLIADDPGMGKSASAIMAKEWLNAKCAVIVCPKGMIETWRGYLSDQVDEDGKQVGYFLPGQAPKVLVAESPGDLRDIHPDDYDYIILSHGRLKSSYTSQLKNLGFDMLIIDEAHELKNMQEGMRSQEIIELSDYVASMKDTYTLMLTATPAPNKVSDIAMILRVLYPGHFAHEDGTPLSNKELAIRIIRGDYIDLRTMLLPRMQRKSITESLKMPELIEEYVDLGLSESMSDIYELLLEEDLLKSQEKIQRIRQFLSNPATLQATPEVESVKAVAAGERLNQHFKTENKVLMFVNDYVDDIIAGEHTIHDAMNIPENVRVVTLWGESSDTEREQAQRDFQKSQEKMLLIVSGSIAGLGIDLSAADRIVLYNHPWNESRKRQMIGRGYRPGRTNPLHVETLYFPGTLEEGMIYYTAAKELAIQKLLNGIGLTPEEQEILFRDEQNRADESEKDINPELAAYYYSSWERMQKMFGYIKEIGEDDFVTKFLPDHGKEYANTYRELSNRSYQANAARLTGTLVAEYARKKGIKPTELRVLDVASGPEMLRRHITEDYADSVISLDINPEHFEAQDEKRIVGSMRKMPMIEDSSIDYANMSLAIHYLKQSSKQGIHERVEALAEINRVLKPGGQATITLLYSNRFEDEEKLAKSLGALGFKIVRSNTGEVQSGRNFSTYLLTIQKIRDAEPIASYSNNRLQGISSGLQLRKTETRVSDTRKVVSTFWIKGQKRVKAELNQMDQAVLDEETEILTRMKELSDAQLARDVPEAVANKRKIPKGYDPVGEISDELVIMNGFSRIFNGRHYVLFTRLKRAIGSVAFSKATATNHQA